MSHRAVPVRTCIGCRERAVGSQLLRVVAVEGRVVPDPRRRLPGRGAHLHPDPACLDLAVRRRAFARALRLPGPLDVGDVAEWVARHGWQTGRSPAPGGVEPPGVPLSDEEAGRDGNERSMSTQR